MSISKRKKKATESKPAERELLPTSERHPEPQSSNARTRQRWTKFTVVAAVIVIILIIIGISLYPTQIAPFRRTIISVDGIPIRMGYFLKRTELAGSDPINMLDTLTREQIIKIEAPQLGITASPGDIDQVLRAEAGGASGNITDSEFREWYRQQLNESRLSDAEYKEIVRTSLLAAGLHEYLAQRVPTVGEQVHVQIIQLDNYDKALEVKKRLDSGEDFAAVAGEVSMPDTPKGGGELGWFPKGVLNPSLDYVAFTLDIGQVSDPIAYSSDPQASDPSQTEVIYFLLKVPEKAVAREIEEDSLQVLKVKALDDWLGQEMQFHDIKYDFNSEINAWINWQLSKRSQSSQQQSGQLQSSQLQTG